MFAIPTPKRRDDNPQVLTVAALNQAVSQLLERNLPPVWVRGEISNFTRASSGHWYFTLKDQDAAVRAVMFKGRASYADFMPRDGDKVEVRAQASLYTPRGDFQLNVENIRRAGMGQLFEAFLRLKAKLEQEGCFASERKRTLPLFPRRLGIITSPQAAALQDVLTALRRRVPHLQVIVYPSPVQGADAGEKLVQALLLANQRAETDLILLVRGGGSIEDLWSFNEEILARAILASNIPVISGVGHETDFTIADFVADLRAPTPTAAAELAARPQQDWLEQLASYAYHMQRLTNANLQRNQQRLDQLSLRLPKPTQQIQQRQHTLWQQAQRLQQALQQSLQQSRQSLLQNNWRLIQAKPQLQTRHWQLQRLAQAMHSHQKQNLQINQQKLQGLTEQLHLLNPQRTLERGYAIARDQHGKLLRNPAQIKTPGQVHLQLAEGQASLNVQGVQTDLTL